MTLAATCQDRPVLTVLWSTVRTLLAAICWTLPLTLIVIRIIERSMPYWADPRRTEPDRINHHDGGRGVYFGDPHTNVGWEIITRPYGSGPRGPRTGTDEATHGQAESDRGDGNE